MHTSGHFTPGPRAQGGLNGRQPLVDILFDVHSGNNINPLSAGCGVYSTWKHASALSPKANAQVGEVEKS